MTPYPTFIAGLFDSPWVVIAILIASGVANWLAQRRAQKEEPDSSNESEPPPAVPPSIASWQERLRKMIEEAEAAPPPQSSEGAAPPLVRRPTPPEVVIVPPVITATETYSAPPRRPPPVAVVAAPASEYRAPQRATKAPGTKPPVSVGTMRRPPERSLLQETLRHPATARQAFVASLVFGTPKGLES